MMKKFLNIEERIPEGIRHLLEEENLYIYGNGIYAEHTYQTIVEWNIHVKGVIVSDEYYTNNNFHELEIFPISEKSNEKISIIAGYDIYKHEELNRKLLESESIIKVYCLEGVRSFVKEGEIRKDIILIDNYYRKIYKRGLDYKYYQNYLKQFMQTYTWLCDELSKQTMECYLEGHIELKEWPMHSVWNKNNLYEQYFPKDIIKLTQQEVVIDCGAFTGDTLENFSKLVNSFKKYYLCEPNKNNMQQIYNIISKVENKGEVIYVPVGLSNSRGHAYFCGSLGSGSMIVKESSDINNYIELDCIDNIVEIKDKITFIKMDIEGEELKALEGAKKIIKRDRPKLAISVYHKKEDLITIPQYLKELVSEYKLYLRAHFPIASELVLYAVCDDI